MTNSWNKAETSHQQASAEFWITPIHGAAADPLDHEKDSPVIRSRMGTPCNEFVLEDVIGQIKKQLSWIGEPNLCIGGLAWLRDETYLMELVGKDHDPVYRVQIDPKTGRSAWSMVGRIYESTDGVVTI